MSSFEVMDPKMDMRMHRKDALTPAKARKDGIIIAATAFTSAHKHAFLQEMLCQFATW